MDEKVKEYMEKQDSSQKEIIVNVREIFLRSLPNCKERFAWGVIVLGDDTFYIASMKNRMHVGFAIEGLSKNEIRLFEGSGKTMRHIKIHSIDDINENRLLELIKMVDTKNQKFSKVRDTV
jgi:hypothetical protein